MDIKRLGSEIYYRTEGFEIGFNYRLGNMVLFQSSLNNLTI